MDVSRFSKTLDSMKKQAPAIAGLVADEISKQILEEVIRLSPKRTGEYSRGWKIEKAGVTKRKIIHPNKKLVSILEFTGSRGGKIEGDPLHFVVDGKDVFVKFANPKGFKPIPHLRPAIKKARAKSKNIIKQVWAQNSKFR